MSGRELLYGVLALAGLLGTAYFNLQYFQEMGGFDARHFFSQGFVNAAASSLTVDLLVAFLAYVVFVVPESRRIGLRHGWIFLVLGLCVAFAFAFPLFLLVRERKLRNAVA